MKNYIIKLFTLIIVSTFFLACNGGGGEEGETVAQEEQAVEEGGEEEEEGGMREVHLSELKFNSLGIKLDTLPTRPLSEVVEATGRLEVPPQNAATVTAILGANVTSIKVIEGDKVRKGQVLAYLSHPNLTRVQTSYITAYSRMQNLEQEFNRQQRLYEEEIGSGKLFQQAKSDFQVEKAEVQGLESQLRQLNLNVEKIRSGDIYEYVPVVNPIDGTITEVRIQVGQYVDPQTEMFEVINTDHVHADLMVFAKDVYKVKEGQKVTLLMESVPGKTFTAEIYSVGKKFEQNPKAVHVHAEIQEEADMLVPGMYINGRIITGAGTEVTALPEEAIIEEEGKSYIFTAEKHEEDGKTEWSFKPVEVITGEENEGWVEIKLLEPLPEDAKVAWNSAYYLIAEMKKGETGDDD
ncbi:efflux RND transporter periplasmic adaptor subunit [Salegentibacter sp. F188]|jgi:cobalt-zinc-cadmium efflux system membrane fusion protein|uniref:Efflux RND transporter periplasmic adaptor subunit n=1 Tax=Autumnicola patrickiae TaxID=3075591 RepID=A0ABU3E4T4_9FLAO|nr:efflux RND transporter periplasmic adaptor subunit [Salegentibacter sp. F188]MDT0690991.1 efflux RND transporter periplasmic adaptor subunit [Salegentibacter sp. F188]|tara:strand:- start:1427 stop:2650 length:1224 start_codon:yes stop_codon:yes gene_type:complete